MLAETFASCGLRLKTPAEVADLDVVAIKRAAKRKAKPSKDVQKARNAAKRRKAGEKQAFQAAKNAAKRVAKRLSLSEAANGEVQDAATAAFLKHTLP